MVSAKPGKLVREDGDGIWLAAPLAAKRTGLTKPELARRALAGKLIFKADAFGNPRWYSEVEITMLARESGRQKRPSPWTRKRPLSAAQLEAKFAKQSEEMAKAAGRGGGGPVSAHYEKVMLEEIFLKAENKGE